MESSKGGDEWRGRQGPDHGRPVARGRTVDLILNVVVPKRWREAGWNVTGPERSLQMQGWVGGHTDWGWQM